MKYVRFGKTGLRVSRICLGGMSFGTTDWSNWVVTDEKEATALIKSAYDAGINFFDTADAYSRGKSEEILGKAIREFGFARDRIVVATKVYFPVSRFVMTEQERMASTDLVNQTGLSRKHIFDAVDVSLKRLGLDYIDIYQIHRLDHHTPIEETVEALHDLVKLGKVRYLGASSMHAWEFQKANHVAAMHGWTQFASMQNLYNLLYREEEREMIPYCIDQGVAQIPWSPLAMGVLCGQNRGTKRSEQSTQMVQTYMSGCGRYDKVNEAIINRVATLAYRKQITAAQVALAWLLTKSHITAPIVGIRKEEHLKEAINALDVKLSKEDIEFLEEPYLPKPVMPFC